MMAIDVARELRHITHLSPMKYRLIYMLASHISRRHFQLAGEISLRPEHEYSATACPRPLEPLASRHHKPSMIRGRGVPSEADRDMRRLPIINSQLAIEIMKSGISSIGLRPLLWRIAVKTTSTSRLFIVKLYRSKRSRHENYVEL